jgi:uncharacterized protein
MKILLLSDSHGYIDDTILSHAKNVDEIWHAGDIGNLSLFESLSSCAPVCAVYGNIDGADIRIRASEFLLFEREGLRIFMTHICGYPGRYSAVALQYIKQYTPGLIVGGHSHILKVMKDSKHNALYMNPGAIGKSGFHMVRTMLRFHIVKGVPQQLELIEYNKQ